MKCFCLLAASIAKICVLVANIAFMVCGIAIIVLGSLMLEDLDDYKQLFDGVFSATPIAVVCVGALALAIGFCGFFGVLVESRVTVVVYSALLVLVLLAKVIVGILALVQYGQVGVDLQSKLTTYFAEEYTGGDDLDSPSFDKIQNTFVCCGVSGPGDFVAQYDVALPASCCYAPAGLCTQSSVTVRQAGCAATMTDWVSDWFQVIGVVALSVIFVEVVLLLLASCLAKHWKKKSQLSV